MTHTTRNSILLFFGLSGLVILFIYLNTDTEIKNIPEEKVAAKIETSVPLTDFTLYEARVKNALITVPDTDVKISLVDGRATYGTTINGGDVTLVKIIGGEKLSTGATYVFADMAVWLGGTGVFHYIALFDVSSGNSTHLSSYFIGDRAILLSASSVPKDSQSYLLKVQYLDRAEGQAMVEEPNVQKEEIIEVKNNIFVQKTL